MLTVLFALLVILLSAAPFLLATALYGRSRRRAALDDELARMVRSDRPGQSR